MRRWLAMIPCAFLACAHSNEKPPPPDPLKAACADAGGRACRELGWKALRGPWSAAADRAAARLFMEGCETKDAQSCADLGALYAAGRGVRRDDGRACALGLADACARAGLPAPTVQREPTERVGPSVVAPAAAADAKEVAAAIDTAEQYARYFITRDLHEPLGATRAALEAEPPAPEDDVQLVRRIIALRRWTISDCLPVYVYPNQNAAPARAWVSIGIGVDGRTRSVRVAPSRSSDGEARERCIAEAISRWEFPAPRVGGRLWMHIDGTGPRRELPVEAGDEHAPAYATASYTRPEMAKPACVQKRVAVSPSLAAMVQRPSFPRNMTVKFAVGTGGDAYRFEVMGPDDAPVELARVIEEAVQSCRWIPGRDPEGRPAPIWVILPIRFQ
jgi:hypothetical protein